MNAAPTGLVVFATKPAGKVAELMRRMGIEIVGVAEDEGNVDRYVVSKRVAVERRTGAAFLRGIMDKTLFTSAIYLREHFRVAILLVEGQVDYDYSMFDARAVRGALSSMMLQYGLSVLWSPEAGETAALVAMIARQEQVGIPEISLIPKRKAADLPDMQRRIVEMLPGCGMVLARQILQHFGTVRRVADADADEFRGLRGIGAKKAREMFRVLTADYEAVDTERDLEDAIEAAPDLLFAHPVRLLARQHCIYVDAADRHVVDMVYLDPQVNEVILVELKRGRLMLDHYRQLRRYLANAGRSKVLGALLDGGAHLRGVLATVAESVLKTGDPRVSICIVDRRRVIEVLKDLRRKRLAAPVRAPKAPPGRPKARGRRRRP